MAKEEPRYFGELVRRDRTAKQLTMGEFVRILNSDQDRPYTLIAAFGEKRRMAASQGWLSRIELGRAPAHQVTRVRDWFSRVLGGNKKLYQTLPIEQSGNSAAVQSAIKKVGMTLRANDLLTFCEFMMQYLPRIGRDKRIYVSRLMQIFNAMSVLERGGLPFSLENLKGVNFLKHDE